MGFYSILYLSSALEHRARKCPQLRFKARRTDSEKRYELRGNKLVRKTGEKSAPPEKIPVFFEDTHLDQVLDVLLPRDADGDLKDVFYAPCPDKRMIVYRQEVMRALEDAEILNIFEEFCRSMESTARLRACGKQALSRAQRYKYTVDGSMCYFNAVKRLLAETETKNIPSEGLMEFLKAVREYADEPQYSRLESMVRRANSEVESISYRVSIQSGNVLLSFDTQENDFVQETREDFGYITGNNAEQDIHAEIRPFGQFELCPLEKLIANELEHRFTRQFEDMREASESSGTVPEPFIERFVSEMRYYFRYGDLMRRLRERGIPFAYPDISSEGPLRIDDAYDIALALKTEGIVKNDVCLDAQERGAIITGANQAGKTTYLCAVGQIALLTALGLPVPCESAELPVFSSFYSHFSETEEPSADYGKLKEELLHVEPILSRAGMSSLVLLNELFSSTTAQDAQDMTECALSLLVEAGARVFCVTHITGISTKRMVSMAPQIEPVSHERLYRIVRAPEKPHAYADEIALKYHLTYQEVRERIENGF